MTRMRLIWRRDELVSSESKFTEADETSSFPPATSNRSVGKLLPSDRADVRNFPARIRESFHRRDQPDDDKGELNEHANNAPNEDQEDADNRKAREDQVDDSINDVEKKP